MRSLVLVLVSLFSQTSLSADYPTFIGSVTIDSEGESRLYQGGNPNGVYWKDGFIQGRDGATAQYLMDADCLRGGWRIHRPREDPTKPVWQISVTERRQKGCGKNGQNKCCEDVGDPVVVYQTSEIPANAVSDFKLVPPLNDYKPAGESGVIKLESGMTWSSDVLGELYLTGDAEPGANCSLCFGSPMYGGIWLIVFGITMCCWGSCHMWIMCRDVLGCCSVEKRNDPGFVSLCVCMFCGIVLTPVWITFGAICVNMNLRGMCSNTIYNQGHAIALAIIVLPLLCIVASSYYWCCYGNRQTKCCPSMGQTTVVTTGIEMQQAPGLGYVANPGVVQTPLAVGDQVRGRNRLDRPWENGTVMRLHFGLKHDRTQCKTLNGVQSWLYVEKLGQPQRVQGPPPTTYAVQLPPGWRSGVDNTGRTFYINDSTQTTQWEPPAMAPPAYTAPPAAPTAPPSYNAAAMNNTGYTASGYNAVAQTEGNNDYGSPIIKK